MPRLQACLLRQGHKKTTTLQALEGVIEDNTYRCRGQPILGPAEVGNPSCSLIKCLYSTKPSASDPTTTSSSKVPGLKNACASRRPVSLIFLKPA